MLGDTEEMTDLTDDQISNLISDPAKIETHEQALTLIAVLDDEIAQIQAQVDTAVAQANVRPLSADREAWLKRASYAAAMKRNERHKVMQRDKEIRRVMRHDKPKDPAKAEANLLKQRRLTIEVEDRRENRRLKMEEVRSHQMAMAQRTLELKTTTSWNFRFVATAKRILPPDLYAEIKAATGGDTPPTA